MLSLPFVDKMLGFADLKPADRILDVGTGTGIVALNAARSVPKATVVGVDLSAGMLATAKEGALQHPAVSVDFRRMDAEALEFDSGSFDVVLSLFALMHFPNPGLALSEMFRVLRPGGRLVLAVGGGPALFSMATVREGCRYLQQLYLERSGKLLIAPAFLNRVVEKHLAGSVHSEISDLAQAGLHKATDVVSLVREAKFTEIKTGWSGHRALIKTAEDFWNIQRTFSSIARKRLATAPAGEAQIVRNEFFEVCREVQSRGGRLVYPTGAFFVRAKRPE